MVLMMRQPPAMVPPAMAKMAAEDDQLGDVVGLHQAAGDEAVAMMPMPFWASLVPWPRL